MKNATLFFASLMLVSCILEPESPVGGGGVNPPENDAQKITITIPGGFSVASTRAGQTRAARATRAVEEDAIHDLFILTFTDDVLTDIHEVDTAADLSLVDAPDPALGTDNQYTIENWSLPAGDHRLVMLANAANEIDNGELLKPFPSVGEVQVGNVIWATTNVAQPGTFADTPYRYDFKSGVRDYQYSWNELTGGTSGNTVAGYCPDSWRLPTQAEYSEMILASTSDWKIAYGPEGFVNGREFTITATSQKLFFPASGRDSGTAKYGEYGLYWSSTQWNNLTGHSLEFGSFFFHSGGTYGKTRTLSVRCVRDAEPDSRTATRAIAGQSLADVTVLLQSPRLTGKMYASGGHVPMWGEAATVADAPASISVPLRRSIARIDVGAGAFDEDDGTWAGLPNFTMTGVTVVGANNKYAVIPELTVDDPDTADIDEGGVPVAPSVPASATAFSLADSEALFTYAGASVAAEIYVPEAEITDAAHGSRMALVIGGLYGTDTTPSYYRVDFKRDDGTLLDVLRNHLYTFSISSVAGRGLPDVESAYNSVRSNMSVTVVGWGEVEFPTEL